MSNRTNDLLYISEGITTVKRLFHYDYCVLGALCSVVYVNRRFGGTLLLCYFLSLYTYYFLQIWFTIFPRSLLSFKQRSVLETEILKKFLWSRVLPVREADNLTAIYESTVYIKWEPQYLTSLQASMAWHRDKFTFICKCYSYLKEIYLWTYTAC
jgi:hypothetical protein